jgi:hypothetical protein
MYGKYKSDKSTFHASHHVTAITFLLIGIITITTSILFVFTLVLNQNHTALAQQQQQSAVPKDISFDVGNVTISHHMTPVNGIQLLRDRWPWRSTSLAAWVAPDMV